MLASTAAAPKGLESLTFFSGSWNCGGAFVPSGRQILSVENFEFDRNAMALIKHHGDKPPATYHAVEKWDYMPESRAFLAVIKDGRGNVREFRSQGWRDGELRWDRSHSIQNQTFIYDRIGDNAYRISYYAGRLVDKLTCRRALTR